MADERTVAKLIGQDGNIFNLIGIASKALKQDGKSDEAAEMTTRVMDEAQDYNHALRIIMEYVDVE